MTITRRRLLRIATMAMLLTGTTMLLPVLTALYYHETEDIRAFLHPALLFLALGLIGFIAIRKLEYSYTKRLKIRDAYLLILGLFLFLVLMSAVPYLLSSQHYTLTDAVFESVASWTTTGATTRDTGSIRHSFLIWRGINNWLGGMLLIIFSVSIFPAMRIKDQRVMGNNIFAGDTSKLSARLEDAMVMAFRIYLVLTVTEYVLLLPSGMTPFYALVNTLTTISSAGMVDALGTRGAYIFSPYIKVIISIFTVVGSLNFMVYYQIYRRRWRLALRNYELKIYLGLILAVSIINGLALTLQGTYNSLSDCFGNALTQTISYASTSGYVVSSSIETWPTVTKITLLLLILIGGCSFSTASGMKVSRATVCWKLILRGIYKRIHPQSSKAVLIENEPVSAPVAAGVTVFVLLYFGVMILGMVFMGLEDMSMEKTMCAVVACLTNSGTFFGGMTSANFAAFSAPGKLWACFLMLLGRLEIYPIIFLFSRSFWMPSNTR